ncbi:tachylectin-related carbohydrate-binding protein [Kribbella sp. NPDC051770]|uniref:tachylectin-related carbohydrate-binding protein n=1 Tax=Kribbella sp. NPDC051770 TaxID=3155413 RepID=UPI003445C4C6
MVRTLSTHRPGRRRRRLAAAVLTAGLLAGGLSTLAAPAQADDADVTCTAVQPVFAVTAAGELMRYDFNDLSSNAEPILARNPVQIGGRGWDQFGKILGGPDGWIYAISAAGTYQYHWNGSTFDVSFRSLGKIFAGWSQPARKNKITMDARGDVYLIEDNGQLSRYRRDPATNTFSVQPVGTGFGAFTSLTAVGDGVLEAVRNDGSLHRYHYEPTSDRYLDYIQTGNSSWTNYKTMLSPGADIVVGINAAGQMLQYRYKRETNTFLVNARQIGTSWQNFLNVFATSNACKLTKSYVPATPSVPQQSYPQLNVLQSADGAVEFAHTDNIGQAKWGHTPDPVDFGGTAWTPLHGPNAFTGTPALAEGADGKLDISMHGTDSRIQARTQTGADTALVGDLQDRSGLMASDAAAGKSPATNKLVLFAVDGVLWGKRQAPLANGFLPWSKFTSPVLSAGTPVIAPGPNNTLIVIVRDVAGTFWSASWGGTGLSAFSSLGGSDFTGKVSVVQYPGQLLRVVARDTDGHIKTQKQTAAGTTWPGTWDVVGDPAQVWPGQPSAVMSPDSGLIEIVARGNDNQIWFAQELIQGSGQFPQFKAVPTGYDEQYPTDPTAFVYTAGGDQKWAIATYNQNFQVRVATTQLAGGFAAKQAADPMFGTYKLS